MKMFVKSGRIGELSEKALISRILRGLGACVPPSPFGGGDDCALLKRSALKDNVYATSDAVIAGRHFAFDTPAKLAAKKLLNRNISDIASMGARPFAALTSAICSPSLSLKWLDEFSEALGEEAVKRKIEIVGGDIASVGGDFFSMHMTLLGRSKYRPLCRAGARAEDIIFVTGQLGRSFQSGAHLNFSPRVESGEFFAKSGKVSACTDISDGLASDLRNILPEGLCAEIDAPSVPLRRWSEGVASLQNALCDGEDYELLAAFRGSNKEFEKFAAAHVKKTGLALYPIGRIKKTLSSKEKNALIVVSGSARRIFSGAGFDHYQP